MIRTPEESGYVVGVIGAGAMGQGIAQVSAQGGMRTMVFDARDGGAEAGRDAISTRIARDVEKGRKTQADADAVMAAIEPVASLSALAECDAVVEAVFEDLDVKRSLFADLEEVVRDDCLIASNTSSIPIASLAQGRKVKGRFAGLHFFNPVPLMKLVEVIHGADTEPAVTSALVTLGARMGRTPVTVKDAPGFLVNMGGRAFTTEGLRIVHEGVATPAQVDAIMRDCRHFRMGPFELMDLTGIDVNFPVSQIIYDEYMHDPRLRTSPIHKAMFEAGRFGRKTGQGWYGYDGREALPRPSPDHAPDAAPARAVVLAEPNPALQAFLTEIGVAVASNHGAPIVAAPIGEDATHTAMRTGSDPRRLVCLDLTGDTSKRVTLMQAPGGDAGAADAVAAAIGASGRAVTLIKDSPGFVAQRLGAMIANLGCYMAEIGLASPEDIDTAMKLGLNYPLGPLEIAEDLGVGDTHRIMAALQEITGEDRYRPSLWLKRRALLGLPAHTPA